MSDILISVVIPTHHRNDLLARCLEQLAPGKQTLAPERYEVIVTDDGKATTAEAMVRERFPWAKWFAGPRQGPAANRNSGSRQARGAWIAFTDDDCIPSPGWLAAYAAAIAAGAPVLEGRTVCKDGLPSILYEAPINENGGNLWACNLMISRSLFEQLHGFNEKFRFWCEDMELNSRIRKQGIQSLFVPQAEVDHPARKRPLGVKAARIWEARVQLDRELGTQTTRNNLPLHVLKARVAQGLQGKWSPGTLLLFASGLVESAYVATHLRQWRRKYAAQ